MPIIANDSRYFFKKLSILQIKSLDKGTTMVVLSERGLYKYYREKYEFGN